MNYKGHLTGGIVTSCIVAGSTLFLSGFNIITTALCALTTLVMSLYPDFDIASKPSRYSFMIGIPAIIYLIYTGHNLEGLLTLGFIALPKIFPHRGLVHTLKFGLLATVCWMYMIKPFVHFNMLFVGVAGMMGYFTHLLLDRHVRI